MKIPVELAVSIFKALGDTTRLQIIEFLRGGEKPVNSISEALKKPQPRVSDHLKVLVDQGFVIYEQKKQQRLYKIKNTFVFDILEAISRVFSESGKEKIETSTNPGLMEGILSALGDKTRLQIIEFLQDGEQSSQAIQDLLVKSQSTVSQHLNTLVKQNMLVSDQRGLQKYYTIKNAKIFDILAVITSFISTNSKEKIDHLAAQDIKDTLF